ncbi:hypothetical protein EP7_004995 [Isosphaeraceae bacterium EP7]
MRRPRLVLIVVAAIGAIALRASADDAQRGRGHVKAPRVQSERDAGYPHCVSPHAAPSITPSYGGYYVGGGWPLHRRGNAPRPDDGTFGWDYTGRGLFRPRVNLGFSHRFRQGSGGPYATEGPKILEPAIEKVREHHEPAEH